MRTSPAAGKSTNAFSCVACLVGVLIMGGILWGALIWMAQTALPTSFN